MANSILVCGEVKVIGAIAKDGSICDDAALYSASRKELETNMKIRKLLSDDAGEIAAS